MNVTMYDGATMQLTAKPLLFTDRLRLSVSGHTAGTRLHLELRDDQGHMLRHLILLPEPDILLYSYIWDGLQDIPYGRYHLDYSCGTFEGCIHLVKRA